MGAEADRVDVVLALPRDPRVDQVLREDAALEQELVVALERVERLVERARPLGAAGGGALAGAPGPRGAAGRGWRGQRSAGSRGRDPPSTAASPAMSIAENAR